MDLNRLFIGEVGIRLTDDFSGFVLTQRGWLFNIAKRFTIDLHSAQPAAPFDRDEVSEAIPSQYRRRPRNPSP